MDVRFPLLVGILVAASACTKLPRPPVVDGTHRVPINAGPVDSYYTAPLAAPAQKGPSPALTAPTTTPPSRPILVAAVAPRIYRIQFAYSSTAIDVSPELKSALLPYATKAERIEIRGRTDGQHWSKGDERVALGRAVAARRLLVANGVDPKHITISYLSGGDYLVDNTDASGKAQNRRVDIVMTAPSNN